MAKVALPSPTTQVLMAVAERGKRESSNGQECQLTMRMARK